MKNISGAQKQFVAEFLGNIAVTWFAAGVIGVFLGGAKTFLEILLSISWGLFFSVAFLYAGIYLIKGVKT